MNSFLAERAESVKLCFLVGMSSREVSWLRQVGNMVTFSQGVI